MKINQRHTIKKHLLKKNYQTRGKYSGVYGMLARRCSNTTPRIGWPWTLSSSQPKWTGLIWNRVENLHVQDTVKNNSDLGDNWGKLQVD